MTVPCSDAEVQRRNEVSANIFEAWAPFTNS